MERYLELSNGLQVQLGHPKLEDAGKLYEAVASSSAELSLWMPWCDPNYSDQQSREWIEQTTQTSEQHSEYSFLIWDDPRETCLGSCGINHMNKLCKSANLGYWVRTSHCGQGIAAAVATEVARYGFQQLGLVRLEINVALGNSRSQRVAEKIGATREGIARNGLLNGTEAIDAIQYALIPSDLGIV